MEVEVVADVERADGRSPNQLRPLACTRALLHRAHGSARWSQGDTTVLAAVYGPKAGVKKNESPERACIEVVWKPKTGQMGKLEREYEMVLKKTLQSVCILTVNPNTTTSVIVQVVNDDGSILDAVFELLACAINAASAALVDAGIPLKHLAVAVCCGLSKNGTTILDPTRTEEEELSALSYMAFPNVPLSVLPEESLHENETIEHGIISSMTQGVMRVDDYFHCIERGCSASAKISEIFRRSLEQ